MYVLEFHFDIPLYCYENKCQVMIFFSAHGVPLTYVEDAGDPYRDQMEDCIALIMGELSSRGILNSHTLAYQVLPLSQKYSYF